ncbi:MAG: MBL fold metallo-hydrolase [Pirellulaceae bacterium]
MGAYFWLPSPPGWLVFTFYAGIACVAFLKPETYRKPVVLTSTVAWIAIAWMLAIRTPPSDRFVATFIDVGHGTSVLLQFPNGESWLYDAGRLGDAAFARWPIEAVLWSEGLRRLNGIVISHADADHYNAIPGLLERFSVDRIVGSHELFANTEPGMVELQIALASRNVPVDKIAAGETMLSMPDVRVEVLHPTTQHLIGKDNANSIVLKIDCFGHSPLAAGRSRESRNGDVCAQSQPIAGGVLTAPHHGSLSQDIYPILRWSRPAALSPAEGARSIPASSRDFPRRERMLTSPLATERFGYSSTHRDFTSGPGITIHGEIEGLATQSITGDGSRARCRARVNRSINASNSVIGIFVKAASSQDKLDADSHLDHLQWPGREVPIAAPSPICFEKLEPWASTAHYRERSTRSNPKRYDKSDHRDKA